MPVITTISQAVYLTLRKNLGRESKKPQKYSFEEIIENKALRESFFKKLNKKMPVISSFFKKLNTE